MKNLAHNRTLALISIFTLLGIAASAHAQIGLDFLNLPPDKIDKIGPILSRFYVFGVSMTVIAALIMFTIGGVQYMIAGDRDPGPARERMKNALFGLILALTSYLILYTINPDLVKEVDLAPVTIELKKPVIEGAKEGEPCVGGSPNLAEQCDSTAGSCIDPQTCAPATSGQGKCLKSCVFYKCKGGNVLGIPTTSCSSSLRFATPNCNNSCGSATCVPEDQC